MKNEKKEKVHVNNSVETIASHYSYYGNRMYAMIFSTSSNYEE
jgi:hypothetical protein